MPPAEAGSGADDGFWNNVHLRTRFPWRGMVDSFFAHAALLGLLYAVSIWPQGSVSFVRRHSLRPRNGLRLSLYLPELRSAPVERTQGGKADPVLARQEIRSVPKDSDNLRQTIVTPPKLKLQSEVELPNLVVFEPMLPAQAPAIVQRQPSRVPSRPQPQEVQPVPSSVPKIFAPRQRGIPDLARFLPPQSNPALAAPPLGEPELPRAKNPAPAIVQSQPARAPSRLQPTEVQPAPKTPVPNRGEAPELARLLPSSNAPALPNAAPEIVQSQPGRAPTRLQPREAQSAPQLETGNQERPPDLAQILPHASEPVLPAKQASAETPRVVALSAHPAEAEAPVKIPEGNRRGTFAASPTGRADATGAPGAGASVGGGARETANAANAPPGISVKAPPAGTPLPDAPGALIGRREVAGAEPQTTLRAAVRAPAVPAIPPPRSVVPESSKPRNELENHVFAGRRAHTLVFNAPNLNSSFGSWIIRYVERKQGLVASPIVAPEVVHTSDPAYPADLAKDGIEGTVVLTATIRADGTVGDVVVAQSLYPQLDRNAVEAFSRWIFRPALKDGEAVDLEAVISVPFHAKRLRY
jgi:TonB family protein